MIRLSNARSISGRDFKADGEGNDLFFDSDINMIVAKPESCSDVQDLDCTGCDLTPGFFDSHIHGAFGYDCSDASAEDIVSLSRRLPECGVSAFLPTTMTIEKERIYRVFDAVSRALEILDKDIKPHAAVSGIHLEGPFLNPSMSGVQKTGNLILPKNGTALIEDLEKRFPGLLKIIDVAPELDGAMQFTEEFSSRYVLSAAHTDCDYDTAMDFFARGGKSVTHILNATSPCLKRAPGILGAVFDSPGVFAEVICDGHHIVPAMLRIISRLIGDRVIVVSDSMRGAGMPDGFYDLGGTEVEVRCGRTYYGPGGSLAGSVTSLACECRELVSCGIPHSEVYDALTKTPYDRLGIKCPTLDAGGRADINVIDGSGRLRNVICRGKFVTPDIMI